MKTLHFEFPVLDAADSAAVLDLVTRVPGVVAALVSASGAQLDVVLHTEASMLLVKEQVDSVLLAEWALVAG